MSVMGPDGNLCGPVCRSVTSSRGCTLAGDHRLGAARERSGKASRRVQPHHAMVSMFWLISRPTISRPELPARIGNDHPSRRRMVYFPTRDGRIALAPGDDACRRRL